MFGGSDPIYNNIDWMGGARYLNLYASALRGTICIKLLQKMIKHKRRNVTRLIRH